MVIGIKRIFVILGCLCLVVLGGYLAFSRWAIRHETLALFDIARNRPVTVELAVLWDSEVRSRAGLITFPVAIVSHGNTVRNTEYSFLTNVLAARGFLVASVQHDLPTDSPMVTQAGMPVVWEQLEKVRRQLEAMFNDVQDFEFTVQNGRLHLLQTRTAKRTPWAAVKIACDLVEEGLIQPNEALSRLEAINLDKVVRSHLSGTQNAQLAQGTVAGIGVAAGRIALDGEAAKRFFANGEPAILVRRETTTADIAGMANAAGILTALGGRTSHAAVVARQLGKVCLVGCADVSVDPGRRTCRIAQQDFTEGDWLTLDGNSGAVYGRRLEVTLERPEVELATIARWRESGSASPAKARARI